MSDICVVNIMNFNKKLLKQILYRIFFIPCSTHSLNLVAYDGVEISFEIVNFSGIDQELYNYFSSKPLSNTRRERRIEATKSLTVKVEFF